MIPNVLFTLEGWDEMVAGHAGVGVLDAGAGVLCVVEPAMYRIASYISSHFILPCIMYGRAMVVW